jgi:hypothetical protein
MDDDNGRDNRILSPTDECVLIGKPKSCDGIGGRMSWWRRAGRGMKDGGMDIGRSLMHDAFPLW